ncbi:hypothetical protein HNR00_002653 [Methylorubrum rhodinum]|uniref:Uncharacterized protein n=1 Tax=Methylorubrum rhodinum TaxID=29428 RepID=A0A840ZK58_9HYPH|nr:hypothetical protein [Methylorubrum rhodinum]MBB5757936.1 hypothetical protein [Methylorubrum rhodinum]
MKKLDLSTLSTVSGGTDKGHGHDKGYDKGHDKGHGHKGKDKS